jgi:hypothetical protein
VAFLRKVGVDRTLSDAQIRPWVEWLAKLIFNASDVGPLVFRLRQRGIDLLGPEKAWLKVLATHGLDEPYGERRNAVVKWLRAEPLEGEEVALLRLTAADNEGSDDSSP